MESLDRLHHQLDSLEELRGIVKTMKALSAASIRQYEQAVESLAHYYRTVELGLHVVLRDMQSPPHTDEEHNDAPPAAIVFGSDHGLCGRFNEEIAQHAVERLATGGVSQQQPLVLAVGARVAASLESAGQPVEEDFLVPGSVQQITASVQQILLKMDEWREANGVHQIFLFYNRHSSRASYEPVDYKLLPIDARRLRELKDMPWPGRRLPAFTMQRDSLLRSLLRQYLFVSLFRACAESQASEHASRLAAMQSAQQNLDERLDEVTLAYRRARQSLITAELLDVVAGFEATRQGGD